MARLSMTIGAVVAEVEIGDAEAAALVADFAAAYGGPDGRRPRRQLRWLVRHLAEYVERVAGEQAEQTAATQERVRVREARRAMKFAQQEEAGE